MTLGLHQQRPDHKKAALLYDFLSVFFILSAPYLVFILDLGFVFELTNLVVLSVFAVISSALAGLLWIAPSPLLRISILAILLLVFVDIQFEWTQSWNRKVVPAAFIVPAIMWVLREHISQILAVVFGTIIAATLVPPIANSLLPDHPDRGIKSSALNAKLPVYVHIILDEHPGIEIFSDEISSHKKLKKEVIAFYSRNSFRIFGRAYSQYYDTVDSIPSLLNFETTGNPDELAAGVGTNSRVLENRYFEGILSKGYEISVYQSAFLDYCGSVKGARISDCLTYNYYGAPSAALAGLDNAERAKIILFLYQQRSFLSKVFVFIYLNLRESAALSGWELPDWPNWSRKTGAIPALPVFDRLIEDVSSSSGGQMFFAHLHIPHSPYSVTSECRVRRPVLQWTYRFRGTKKPHSGPTNSPESRLAAYEGSIAQIRCSMSKLEKLFTVMKERGTFDDAVIIIHGDHGSRIVLNEPRQEFVNHLTRQDYFDAFSTLYVVKSPAIEPGYDARMMALPELLEGTVSGSLNDPAIRDDKERAVVYLRDGEIANYLEVPMPEFKTGEDSQ